MVRKTKKKDVKFKKNRKSKYIRKNNKNFKGGNYSNNLQLILDKNKESTISQSEFDEMYQLLFHVINFLTTYKIPYIAFAGTLIGAIRNKGVLYWDDDMDIAIHENDLQKVLDLEPLLNSKGFSIYKFWGGIKIFYTNNKLIKNKGWKHIKGEYFNWSWPFVDIFLFYENDNKINFKFHEHKSQCHFKKKDFYPLKNQNF